MKAQRLLIWVQGIYTLLTALWPLIDIKSFMEVTGYKTDIWLVKTVGALLIPVSLTILYYNFIRTDDRPVLLLASTTAVAFITVDLYYALHDIIPDIYLADAAVESVFLGGWIWVISHRLRQVRKR